MNVGREEMKEDQSPKVAALPTPEQAVGILLSLGRTIPAGVMDSALELGDYLDRAVDAISSKSALSPIDSFALSSFVLVSDEYRQVSNAMRAIQKFDPAHAAKLAAILSFAPGSEPVTRGLQVLSDLAPEFAAVRAIKLLDESSDPDLTIPALETLNATDHQKALQWVEINTSSKISDLSLGALAKQIVDQGPGASTEKVVTAITLDSIAVPRIALGYVSESQRLTEDDQLGALRKLASQDPIMAQAIAAALLGTKAAVKGSELPSFARQLLPDVGKVDACFFAE